MRLKLVLLFAATVVVLTGCSRLDALHVENTCDFPVTVRATGPTELAVKTLGPGAQSVVLEGFWGPNDPFPLSIRTVEIAYEAVVDMSTLPDVRVSFPPAVCERTRVDITPSVLIDIGWNGGPSTVNVTGPAPTVDGFVAAAGNLTGAASSLDRPTDHAAELTVWPSRAGTEIVNQLLQPLFERDFIWVSTCEAGSACRNANVVDEVEAVPAISLPAAERSDPWTAPVALLVLAGAATAVWGSTRHRRKTRKAEVPPGT